ncbi:MAG TPA: GNAT family N-acetyltransferase [Clostridia bacterium]|nr:GNAT family N-acetyltransferase [Clostridia bacterium]
MILQFKRYDKADDYIKENESLYFANELKNLYSYGILKYSLDEKAVFISVYDGLLPIFCAFIRSNGKMYLTHEIGEHTLETIDFFVDGLITHKIEFSVVSGEQNLMTEFAKIYANKTKSSFVPKRELSTMSCEETKIFESVKGVMRKAVMQDLHTITCFMLELARESNGFVIGYEVQRALTLKRLNAFYVWETDGQVVSCLQTKALGSRGMMLSSVYTDPNERGKGYGSSLVGNFTKLSLQCCPKCFLKVDLFNQAAKRMYKKIGYEYGYKLLEGSFYSR